MDSRELMQYPIGIRRVVLEAQAQHQVAADERDALRKEVERYKRALEKAIGLGHYCPPGYTDCDDAGSDIKDCAQCRSQWALSEAGKGDEG